MITEKQLKDKGWTVPNEPVWFGLDYQSKTNVLELLTELLDLDSDVHGYNFCVCAYKEVDNES